MNASEYLREIVSVKRPYGGKGECTLAARLASSYPVSEIDQHGNILIRIGESRTLFTSHLDTVHHDDGPNLHKVQVRDDVELLCADGGVPLGADDGAGVALMMYMMDNKVPGNYIFFRGEECGGEASSGWADANPKAHEQYDRSVAFDRAGYYDIISVQGGMRTASDTFCDALSAALSDLGLMYATCDRGVFTDTRNLVGVIRECTNVSVGYFRQHSSEECQDLKFLDNLAQACCKIDWEHLPTEREIQGRGQRRMFSFSSPEPYLSENNWPYADNSHTHYSAAYDAAADAIAYDAAADAIVTAIDTGQTSGMIYAAEDDPDVFAEALVDLWEPPTHISVPLYPAWVSEMYQALDGRDVNSVRDLLDELRTVSDYRQLLTLCGRVTA